MPCGESGDRKVAGIVAGGLAAFEEKARWPIFSGDGEVVAGDEACDIAGIIAGILVAVFAAVSRFGDLVEGARMASVGGVRAGVRHCRNGCRFFCRWYCRGGMGSASAEFFAGSRCRRFGLSEGEEACGIADIAGDVAGMFAGALATHGVICCI